MKFGMTNEQYQILDSLLIQPLKDQGAQVYIFGSRSLGKHHPYSDVDILYKTTSEQLPAGFISSLKESIEESRFPFIVDLVADSDLADSYRPSVLSSLKLV